MIQQFLLIISIPPWTMVLVCCCCWHSSGICMMVNSYSPCPFISCNLQSLLYQFSMFNYRGCHGGKKPLLLKLLVSCWMFYSMWWLQFLHQKFSLLSLQNANFRKTKSPQKKWSLYEASCFHLSKTEMSRKQHFVFWLSLSRNLHPDSIDYTQLHCWWYTNAP